MQPRRILFIAEGQLGDLLVLTPALRATKKTYPSSHISVLVIKRGPLQHAPRTTHLVGRGENTPLDANPHVDAVFTVQREALRSLHGIKRLKAELRIVGFLKAQRFDTIVCTFPEDRFVLWARAARASIRVGQRTQGLHWLLTRTPDVTTMDGGMLRYYYRLVEQLGVVEDGERTDFIIPDHSHTWAEETLSRIGYVDRSKLVLVHPGASGDYRIWPPDRFATLIDRLFGIGLAVILTSGPSDIPVVREIRRFVRTNPVEVETNGHVGNFAALMKRCRLCISNNSGPRHLAAAIGTPNLSIFPQHHFRDWRIYPESATTATVVGAGRCPTCPADVCKDVIPQGERFGSVCLRMVSVEQVVARVNEVLASR
jgi:ADP-heptose:LPS heptosyltransferase